MAPIILVVDDDRGQLSATARILRRSRYEVRTAPGGRVGLRLALQTPPALILLDISMPTMSGHDFLRRLRRLERTGRLRAPAAGVAPGQHEIPVIFVSALSAPHQRVNGLDAGAVDYVVKPFDADELRARIRRHLHAAGEPHSASAAPPAATAAGQAPDDGEPAASPHTDGTLASLNRNIALAGSARQPRLRAELLARARCDARRLVRDLAERSERRS